MIFVKPNTEKEAVSLLNNSNGISRIQGGGTDVLVQMRSGIIEPELIIEIKNIPGIREIKEVNGGYEIGAAVSGSNFKEVIDNISLKYPSLKPQITRAISLAIDGKIYKESWFAPINEDSEVDLMPYM